MKFKIFGLENELPITEGISCISILNKNFYKKFMYELMNASNEDTFCLLDDGIEVEEIQKYVNIITNPYVINLDDKKIVNAFYKELSMQIISDDDIYTQIITKIGEIQDLLQHIESDLDFIVETNENISDILKYFKVSLKKEGVSVLDNLYQYIDIFSRWCKGDVLLFTNCLAFLGDAEIEELNKYAKYHNCKMIFVETEDIVNKSINKLTIYEDFSDSLAIGNDVML